MFQFYMKTYMWEGGSFTEWRENYHVSVVGESFYKLIAFKHIVLL